MKTYLFLLAWVDGSEGASGDPTMVHCQDDLLLEYNKANEYIFALYIAAPNENVAANAGYSHAFHNNYTGYNTVSVCLCVDGVDQNNDQDAPLIVVDVTEN